MKKEKSQFGCPRLALFGYSMHILFVESLYHDFKVHSKYIIDLHKSNYAKLFYK
ncbi:MAG: hypothetical protein KA157_08325 [Aliarcobacter sp.]|nr:hypothetical protein [Aliarcobacter sp.]